MKVQIETNVTIPVTDEMVQRVAEQMEDYGWLPKGWDNVFDDDEYICKCCGKMKDGDGDGGESTRYVIREFLETALEGV